MNAPAPLTHPADLQGRTILVRAVLSEGPTADLLSTIAALCAAGARVAVIAGFGAPAGDFNPTLSLARFGPEIERAAGRRVSFVPECVGPVAEAALDRVPFGEVALMENLRFHPDGRRGNRAFALRLSALGDGFVVTGPVPEPPAAWITALADLLPPVALPAPATERV